MKDCRTLVSRAVSRWCSQTFRCGLGAALAVSVNACSSGSTADSPPQSTGGSAGAAIDGSTDGSTDSPVDVTPDGHEDADASEEAAFDAPLDSAEEVSETGPDAKPPCQGASDCVGDPAGAVCNPATGRCVQCLAGQVADCALGAYCDATTSGCKPGCDANDDCAAGADAGTSTCDTTTHHCVGCTLNDHCPAGQTCKGSACEDGCTAQHGCAGSLGCCTGACVNLQADLENCGVCGSKCAFAHAQPVCSAGVCTLAACDPGFANCNAIGTDGCETEVGDGGAGCACQPGTTRDCYSGTVGTQDVGPCKAGLQTCDPGGTSWGACVGEVLPVPETCMTVLDDDCDGLTNESGANCVCQPDLEEPCYSGALATRGVGACTDGLRKCNAAGTAWGGCQGDVLPATESCLTPVDDDCDGAVNEIGGTDCACAPNSKASCYSGANGTQGVGVCAAGSQPCNAMGTAYGPCEGDVVPSADICTDSLDNDCNGTINDGIAVSAAGCVCVPGANTACYEGPVGTVGVGVCAAGVATCAADGAAWGPCNGQVLPSPDVCTDGLDNDCNGAVNDGFATGASGCVCAPGGEQDCYTGATGTLGIGVCVGGKKSCAVDGTAWSACFGETIPDLDTCLNALDDDCDGVVNNGYPNAPGCACIPGTATTCYSGAAGTAGVGVCKTGIRTCGALGVNFSGCVGEVAPVPEICGNGLNDDCVGGADDPPDTDGDGWNRCQGDCCETAQQCSNPLLVNPGAFDVSGNGLDDNCDGVVDNAVTACGTGLVSNSAVASDYAKALDICQTTTVGAKTWGLISANLLLANGTGVPNASSRAIRPGFGTNIATKQGPNFVVLSSGSAADANDTNPGYVPFQTGLNAGTSSPFPADWFQANGNTLPSAPGCNASASQTIAFDPVMLQLTLRAPTNAKSFSVDMAFFSAEYPEYVCSPFNDFFVMLLNSSFAGTPANPTDRNLAFFSPSPSVRYPIGINLAYLNNGLFSWCMNGPVGCMGTAGAISTCTGTTQLAGTGFEVAIGGCGANNLLGGGTGWLISRGNVVPGEVLTLRFAIWDTGDHVLDSLVLLDNFRWSLDAAQPGTSLP